jgi:hypothetical protein
MDKGTRSRLFELMDNLPQIEEWRRTLTFPQRFELNHPNAVLRRWKAFISPEPRTETGEPKPTLRDSVANLSEEVAAKDRRIVELESHVAELEAARTGAGDIEAAVDIINAQAEKMSPADYKKTLLRITWVNDLWAILTADSAAEGTDSTLEDRLKELKAMTLGGFSLSPRRKTTTVARSPESDIGELRKAMASTSLSPKRKR